MNTLIQSYRRTLVLAALASIMVVAYAHAQTTNGLIAGTVYDSTNAVVLNARVTVTNNVTSAARTAVTNTHGFYIVPQLSPGAYTISVSKSGFATMQQANVSVAVNQNETINFTLRLATSTQTVEVTGAPPPLNTTSATLGTVINNTQVVDLPLNGRQFTELTLLTPGAAPIQAGQQNVNQLALGAGGIDPSVNGQRPRNDNYTMDGTLNNSIFPNIYAISPPPDAIQEFNVQSHITDAQFSISTGANINIETRAGTDQFHGSLWEFIRNDVLDARQFPETERNPYKQNQYGLYLGGPVVFLMRHSKYNTWFAVYWEGFRSANTLSYLASTFTPAMRTGDFSALLGPQIGIDDLDRPEYQNEIYDPATSRPDPINPNAIIRDPFPGNIIPSDRINPNAPQILSKYYPLPNLNVAANVLPNYQFPAANLLASDQVGIRIDQRINDNNTIFGRYNRSNINASNPEALPGYVTANTPYVNTPLQYSQEYALDYTHLFSDSMTLNLRYGFTQSNTGRYDTPAGASYDNALQMSNFLTEEAGLALGPNVNISNGYTGVSQNSFLNGPNENNDYHVDFTKVFGPNMLSAGGMIYTIHSYNGGMGSSLTFTQNATSQGGVANATGMGPASFMLGLPNSYSVEAGNPAIDQRVHWYGGYLQDQWQVSHRLSVTAGLRYDYVSPPDYTKTVSALDITNGQFIITAPSLPLFPKAVGSSHLFYPQYNGLQPRIGLNYQANSRTVFQAALAVMDDHNNTLVQLNGDPRVSWPSAVQTSKTILNEDLPSVFINNLPDASTFLNAATPYVAYGFVPHNRIFYAIEYNAGVEQQFSRTLVGDIDYVGSGDHNELIQATGNTAKVPGPGSLSSRGQPYPQYGGPFNFTMSTGPASYSALQAKLQKSMSNGLFFLAAYTWSKSLDIQSDAYAAAPENVYNLHADWGPSDYNIAQMFVFSSVYALPFTSDRYFHSRATKGLGYLANDWNVSAIVSLHSGAPFSVYASGDVANVGGGGQRAEQIGNPFAGFHRSINEWFNTAAFANPAQYTFGNAGRNSLTGPSYKDLDVNAYKNILITQRITLQFRSEFYNILNHANYNTPANTVLSSSLGKITSAGPPREIQFALKVMF